jgi:hypothetical protein
MLSAERQHGVHTIDERFQLSADAPPVDGGCKHNDIGFEENGEDGHEIVVENTAFVGRLEAGITRLTRSNIQLILALGLPSV